MPPFAVTDLQDDISIFEQSSPESLRNRARALSPQLHDHLSSTSDDHTLSADTDDDYSLQKPVKECTSSRSSISSFPASVIHNVPFTDTEDAGFRTSSRSQNTDRMSKSPAYLSAFRNPSSVRALQLESEYADSDTPNIRNSSGTRRSPRPSYFSRNSGSAHSSPTKRTSRPGTPRQQSSSKLKKEFPLVLLHCSLLPPAVAARGPLVSEEILEAVLPEEYRKRWKLLQDKVAKNSEVRQRGVLISHPREDYDLLEERLLETLELERPIIRNGHYLGSKSNGSDSGFESSSQNGSEDVTDDEEKPEKEPRDRCPDCGQAVSCNAEQERRWEVKVFAANGLMRSGAWSAAWEEMEKVDVEVGVWMPEDVRTEVEERLKALQAKEDAERLIEEPPSAKKSRRKRSYTARLKHDERMKEIYGDSPKEPTQEEIDGLADAIPIQVNPPERSRPTADAGTNRQAVSQSQEDFPSFMKRHFDAMWSDQKNLAILLLSLMVLIFSFQNAAVPTNTPVTASVSTTAGQAPSVQPEGPNLSYLSTTVLATTSALVAEPSIPAAVIDEQTSTEAMNQSASVTADFDSPATESEEAEAPVLAPEDEFRLPNHDAELLNLPESPQSQPKPAAAEDVDNHRIPPIDDILAQSKLVTEPPVTELQLSRSAVSVGAQNQDHIEQSEDPHSPEHIFHGVGKDISMLPGNEKLVSSLYGDDQTALHEA